MGRGGGVALGAHKFISFGWKDVQEVMPHMKVTDIVESGRNVTSLCVYITRKVNEVAKLHQTGTTFCFTHKGLSTKKYNFITLKTNI